MAASRGTGIGIMVHHTPGAAFLKAIFVFREKVTEMYVQVQAPLRDFMIFSAFGMSPVASLECTRRPSTMTSKAPFAPWAKVTEAPHSTRNLSARLAAR
jgi:hypothetical protein